MEFRYGDRVRWVHSQLDCPGGELIGTVVDERLQDRIFGSYESCLPLPVAVRWDDVGIWWSPGQELELA